MIEIVSATRFSEQEFWDKSALGASLQRLNFDVRITTYIAFENQKGLPEIFNKRIFDDNQSEILVFIHDDVWIDDFFIADRILDAVQKYDVFGVVGNQHRKHLQPSWAFLNIEGQWDVRENLSGAIAHSQSAFGKVSYFGSSDCPCEILDGVLIGAKKSALQQAGVCFDEKFNFHFYDVDFCVFAQQKGLKIGTWPLALTHQSSGGYGEQWLYAYNVFCQKWDPDNFKKSIHNFYQGSAKNMDQMRAHNLINNELMAMIPEDVRRIIDVGCMHGQMANVYKKAHPVVNYVGIDIDPDYVELAKQHCDLAFAADVENMTESQWDALFPSDCWILDDCLKYLRDPWTVLHRIRDRIDPDGCILVCMSNAQHWEVQARLLSGQLFYENGGFIDRTHIHFFTRTTMLDMFFRTNWSVVQGFSKTLEHLTPDASVVSGLRQMALACGTDPDIAVSDALPLQYMFKLAPA